MTDVHPKDIRSYNMSMIKSKNTKPEIIVRKYLFKHGFRYRINVKSLPGKPDIVLKKYHTVIFINGCFWHGHEGCKYFIMPKTKTEWWQTKITRNKERDASVRDKLRQMGWNTMIVWECQLKPKVRQQTLEEINLLLEKTYLNIQKIHPIQPYVYKEEINFAADNQIPYNTIPLKKTKKE